MFKLLRQLSFWDMLLIAFSSIFGLIVGCVQIVINTSAKILGLIVALWFSNHICLYVADRSIGKIILTFFE